MSGPASIWRSAARSCAALIVFGLCACGAARAGCFDVHNPLFVRLRPLMDDNAARALSAASARLASLLPGAARTEPERLAALYAIQSEALGALSLNDRSRASALKGLALLHDPADPLRLVLISNYGYSFNEPAGITKALALVRQARAAQKPGSRNDLCLEIVQGTMNQRRGRPDLAIRELTRAYLESTAPSLAEPRMEAASMLALVLKRMGDFDQALALIGEVIQWDTARGSTAYIGIDAYLQGKILRAMGHFRQAIGAFRRARDISLQQGDHQGIAYADLRICQSQIGLGQFAAARRACERAAPVLSAGHAAAGIKEAQELLARIDLAEGQPARALLRLDHVLDHGGADLLARDVAPAYLARAQANAALRHYRSAYRNLRHYLRLYATQNQAARVRLQEALEVRFHASQEIERNVVLRRKLQTAARHARRQDRLLHWIGIASVAGALVIALLSYIGLAGRLHRRQLLQLASEDNLTGVPNRGHTVKLAAAALQSARARSQPLTVALLDFDHFKEINDHCGHAAGDHVLREFAQLARGALRASDVLGRWGGEEFLLVLPETTLDTALSSIERLRLLALGIAIPAHDRPQPLPRVTFSAGLATTTEGAGSLDEIVARADAALYEAKNAGRDLVRIDPKSYGTASGGIPRARAL